MTFEYKNIHNDSWTKRIADGTNPQLVKNVHKVFDYIANNYPNVYGTFHTSHDAYTKLDLVIERNGEIFLCSGSHCPRYEFYLGKNGTARYSQGSMQTNPYFYNGVYAMHNDYMIKFLTEWKTFIKNDVEAAYKNIANALSEDFEA